MVVYKLACASGHSFEGWYASADAYEVQLSTSRVECPSCGSAEVRKLPSAPYVNTGASAPAEAPAPQARSPSASARDCLKTFILSHTENVGRQFPEVARRIHYGEESPRGIRGRATLLEAEELREEGIGAVSLHPDLRLDDVH